MVHIFSCTETEDKGDTTVPPAAPIDDEVAKLKIEIAKLKKDDITLKKNDSITNVRVTYLEKDSAYQSKQISDQSKQIALLKKYDSLNTIKVNSYTTRYLKDSALTWKELGRINSVRRSDSIKNSVVFKSLTPLTYFRPDSVKQWSAIKILQSASPVTQIPIMKNDIKNLQTKNTSQDKFIVSHSSSIKNIEDTLIVYKKTGSPDFGPDASGRVQISPAGMVRIKKETQAQP